MPTDHREIAFEDAIEEHLLENGGYKKGDKEQFDPKRSLDPTLVLSFINKTQPKEWEYLKNLQ